MPVKSYRKQRYRELSQGVEDRLARSGKSAQYFIRARTPIGTPASTGDPNYPVTMALWRSIEVGPADKGYVDIGTNKHYGPYVHQGTYDYAHGYGGWTEAEAREFDSLTDTGDGRGVGLKGMKARPFLVNGLLNARPAIRVIWEVPIN